MIARAMNRPIRFCRRGFSLVEVLLAIFILGIGIISITALFPAGIAQQRLSNDDVLGPMVANNAISIIRSKVRQEDFGSFEDYQRFFNDTDVPQAYFSRTVPGDWGWMRPGVMLGDDPNTADFNEQGAIDIFSERYTQQAWGNWGGFTMPGATELPLGWPDPNVWSVVGPPGFDQLLYGIPYDVTGYDPTTQQPAPPSILISQAERYYPMRLAQVEDAGPPQYVWDCMFRRYQGRVQVAIFVYRVSAEIRAANYSVPVNTVDADLPSMPHRLEFINAKAPFGSGPRDVRYRDGRAVAEMLGSEVNMPGEFDPESLDESWQRTRQWLLDQNGNVHRVVDVAFDDAEGMLVELSTPLEPAQLKMQPNDTTVMIGWAAPFNDVRVPSDTLGYYFANPFDPPIGPNLTDFHFDVGVLTDLWYIPRRVDVDYDDFGTVEFTLTPVYVTVKEL